MPADQPSDASKAADPASAREAPSATARARRIAGRGRTRPPKAGPDREPETSSDPAADLPPEPAPEQIASVPSDVPVEDLVLVPGAEPEKKSRAGRDLPVAIGVGLGLGVLIVASLFVYRPSFGFLVAIAVVYGCWELNRALRTATIRLVLTPLLVGSVALVAAAWQRGPNGLVVAALVTLLGIAVWRVGDGAHAYTRDVAASAFVLLYVPVLAGFAVLLVRPDDGAARILAFVATVVCSDTGGYATGVLFGRHPLAPVVSKAKTWEGFAGSVIACSIAGILFLTLTFHQSWWEGLLFGLAIVVTATVGDLGESMIKRDVGIKDMGTLLPGHGGMMDRLDSLLPCAAVSYLLLSAFAPV